MTPEGFRVVLAKVIRHADPSACLSLKIADAVLQHMAQIDNDSLMSLITKAERPT